MLAVSVGFCCVVCSGYQNKHGYNCSWFVYTPLSSWMFAHKRTSEHTHTWNWRPHIYSMRNDSSKCYFRTRLKTTFSITIKTSLFNLIWKVFFFRLFAHSFTLAHMIPYLCASSHRFGIVILWFGVSLSQFNLLSICLCRSTFASPCSVMSVHFTIFCFVFLHLVVRICVCVHSQGLERSLMKTCN